MANQNKNGQNGTKRDKTTVHISIPDDVLVRIKRQAAHQHRSTNAQIGMIVELSFENFDLGASRKGK